MTLYDALIWVTGGPGAGAASYWLMGHIPYLMNLRADVKRYVSLALAAALSLLAWGLMMALGYALVPSSVTAAAEQIFLVVLTAVLTSQGVHGAIDLRRRANGA